MTRVRADDATIEPFAHHAREQVPDSRWRMSALAKTKDLVQPRLGQRKFAGLCALEFIWAWRLFSFRK